MSIVLMNLRTKCELNATQNKGVIDVSLWLHGNLVNLVQYGGCVLHHALVDEI